jgi:hypothetical protein
MSAPSKTVCLQTRGYLPVRGIFIDLALDLAKNCAASYRKARPEVRKMWNQAFFRKVVVRDSRVDGREYEEPFASLLGSHKSQIVEVAGIEPASPGDRLGLLRA